MAVVMHVVCTRAAYGPEWSLAANRRRLALTRAVTARLMSLQTSQDWTWVVLLDERDPLLEQRTRVFADAAPRFAPILWTPGELRRAPWDRHLDRDVSRKELVASTAYGVDWRAGIPAGEPLLQTRLDDDDGLRPDALHRYHRAAWRLRGRTVLMLPLGVRVYGDRYAIIRHRRNAMHTLYTPAGDDLSVYAYGHTQCDRVAPVRIADRMPGWLWVRHRDTISGWRDTQRPVDARVRSMFPVDWGAIQGAS